MEIRKVEKDGDVTIFLEGKFTFADKDKFHEIAFMYPKENVTSIIIDCINLEYMDSNAIGMLLVLHENTKKRGVHVRIQNIGKNIKPLFTQSALGSIFEVEYSH